MTMKIKDQKNKKRREAYAAKQALKSAPTDKAKIKAQAILIAELQRSAIVHKGRYDKEIKRLNTRHQNHQSTIRKLRAELKDA